MAVTYYYSTMGGGKSTYALQMHHSLTKKTHNVVLMKSAIDTRDPGVIKSRIGIEQPCTLITPDEDIFLFKRLPAYILVDEAQFLTKKNILGLIKLADRYNIELIFFGLKTSYTGELFEGSATILALADTIRELPFISADKEKAIMHVRYVDGKPVFNGDAVHVGGDETYDSVSRKEWFDLYEKSLLPKFKAGDFIKSSKSMCEILNLYESQGHWYYTIRFIGSNLTGRNTTDQIDPYYELIS
mgnify:CR=1 FL=1